MPQLGESDGARRRGDALTIAQLRAIVAVGQVGSFTEAARILGISQSAVSRAVASVEESLGKNLVRRTTRVVKLTRSGETFTRRAVKILAELDTATDAVSRPEDMIERRLSVACSVSVANAYMPALLTAFKETHPGVVVELLECLHDEIENSVAAGRSELGITNVGNLHPTLDYRQLWSERYHVCVPRSNELAQRSFVELSELTEYDFIGFPDQNHGRSWLDSMLAAAGLIHSPRLQVSQYSTAFRLVEAGHGLLILPSCAASGAPSSLAFPFLGDGSISRTLGAIWHRGQGPTDLGEAFVETLLDVHTRMGSALEEPSSHEA